ncbi:MAG: hypothetical protein ACREB0_00165 [Sphingopyxis sp.]
MFVNGVNVPNITCPVCRFRHPAAWSCGEAARLAQEAAERRIVENPPEPSEVATDCCTHCTVTVEGVEHHARLSVINCALKCLSCGETYLRSQLEPMSKV